MLSLYDGEVLFADFLVGQLLAQLERSSRAQRHARGVHGGPRRRPGRSPPLFRARLLDLRLGAAHSVSVEASRRPRRGHEPRPDRRERRFPAHAARSRGRAFASRRRGPLARPGGSRQEAPDPDGVALAELFGREQGGEILSLRNDRYRYVYNANGVKPQCSPKDGPYAFGVEQLFDLAADPGETRDRAGELPLVAAELRRTLLERYGPRGPSRPRCARPTRKRSSACARSAT